MRFLEETKRWLGEITEIFLLLIALGIAVEILFGRAVPFLGAMIDNLKHLLQLPEEQMSHWFICITLIFIVVLRLSMLPKVVETTVMRAIPRLLSSRWNKSKPNRIQLAASVVYLYQVKKSMSFVYIVLSGGIIFYLFSIKIVGGSVSAPFVMFPFGALVLLTLRDVVIRYRIERGYFGLNAHESRQLIRFILKNSEKVDFTDSNGNPIKAILPIQKEYELGIITEGIIT